MVLDTAPLPDDALDTIYGRFSRASRKRLNLTYDYEHGAISAFAALVRLIGATRVFDIGANIGVYSVRVCQIPSVKSIHAYEPGEGAFDVLSRNAELQADPAIIDLQNTAVSDVAERCEYAVFGKMAGNNALLSTMPAAWKAANTVEVETARIDDGYDMRGETFALKLDVEGHELKALLGAREYLSGNKGFLQVESFPGQIDEVREVVKSMGYRRIFRMKQDHYFTNIEDTAMVDQMMDILFDQTAESLAEAQKLKELRRKTIRDVRTALDTVRFERDPVIPPG